MKLNKIVTLTLANSFTLLVFASILASCQKKSYSRQGFFTQKAKLGRSIASLNKAIGHDKFKGFQDPKQIYIYCSMTSVKVEQCYNHELSKTITTYVKKFGPFKPEEVKNIFDQTRFSATKEEMNSYISDITAKMNHKMNKQVQERKEFCIENSKFYLRRCLSQYLERDTFSLINTFQSINQNLNGHEYLYLKKRVEISMREKLLNAEKEIRADRQPANE